jgi:predicted enzyme related to lactoylglutathione lyase
MYWMDLSEGDVTFYRDLFGWEPAGSGLFTVDDQVVAGHGAPGPPGWNLHAVVDDVAAVCATVEEFGGEVVLGSPAFATVTDPTGAVFVVREPGRRADLLHKPMTFSWAELCTPDTGAARSFYSALFGWDTVDVSMSMPSGPVNYTVFLAGTAEAAGLMPSEGPPGWLAYVEATDVDTVAAHVVRLGGEVLTEPFDVPRIGRIALLAGRSGETFAVMEMPGGG